MRDLTQQALRYAARGWRVVPLHTPNGDRCDCGRPDCRVDLDDKSKVNSVGKHPRIKEWTINASCDEATVREWWKRWPHANIGIATGPESGLVVLDVDPRNDGYESLTKLTDEHGLMPHTVISNTGGGGWHFYLKHPGRKVISHTILPGLDVKGDGGMVVAPASAHATGILYEWCDDCGPDEPLADIPAWLDALMAQAAPAGLQRPPVTDVLASGDRNQGLFRLGSGMRSKGFSEPAIYAALLAENNERCVPPLAQTEVAVIAASASKYEPSEGIPIIGTGQAPANLKQEKRRIDARTLTMLELQDEVLPPLKMAVAGLMPIGLALLAGRLKLGKSWLMLGTSIAISEGGVALGQYPVEDGDVLYLAYEDTKRRLQNRGKVLLGTGGRWPGRLHLAPSGFWPGRSDGGLEAIDAWVGSHPDARMVVIDTLQRFRGAEAGESEKNSYAADYQVSADLQELALKHEVVIVAIHHFRKSLSETDWVDQISGTNGIAGAADTIMGFERQRGNKTAFLMVTGRDIDEAEYALEFDETRYGWVISGTAEDLRMTEEGREFAAAVREIGRGAPVHYRQIAEHLGKKRNTVVKLAGRLAERGIVLSLGGGMYKCVTGVTDPQNRYEKPVTGGVSPRVTEGHSSLVPEEVSDSGDTPVKGGVSPLFESKNGLGDSVTAKTENPVDRWLSHKSISRDGDGPCGVCGEHNWIPRATGGYVCDTCKPWIRSTTNEGV